MRTIHLVLPLAAAVAVAMPLAHAEGLTPSTAVTARYDVVGWLLGRHALPSPSAFSTMPAVAEKELAAIEPAEGGEPATGSEDGDKGHATSASGKNLTGGPTLPTVTIGGQTVMTHKEQMAKDASETTPVKLKGNDYLSALETRVFVTPYAHAPSQGPVDAPIKVVEFVDLSCSKCLPDLAKIDTVLQDYVSQTRVMHIDAPRTQFQDTNLAAFYGKVAARAGNFWQYRANLIADKPATDDALFGELMKSGVSARDARTLMMNDARAFYREIDADALLARSFVVEQPPVVFVNGIRVGGSMGLPLDLLGDVLHYVTGRLQRNLPEPPQ